ISNVNTQFVALQSGEVDVILNANLASCLQLDPNVASWAYCDSATRALMLMQSNPASGSQMVDENLRKAIACCVNREDLVIGVCEGYGSPSWYDTVPSYLGAPALEDCTLAAEYDLDKAKEYLEASNYDGSPLSIYCNSGSRAEQAANIIQGAMIAAGINAEVKAVDGGTSSAAMASGEYDMLIAESTGSQFDTGCLGNIYTTPSFAQMMSDEAFAWMDEKIQAQRQETDPEARKALTAEILSYMNENTISVPLYLPAATIAFNKDLKGVVAHPQTITHLQDWSW
ncbi:MAG: hypothetical protein K2G28_10900, partial [Acetatifactor sp.]|nr:hypothetical protein [Acetatifactor sp.]